MRIDLSTVATILGVIVTLALATIGCEAEIVQLVPMEIKVEADSLKERSPAELSQIESAKRFIIDFIAKWDADRKSR